MTAHSYRPDRIALSHGEHGKNNEDGGPACHGGPGTIADCQAMAADILRHYVDSLEAIERESAERFLSAHVQVIAVPMPGALYATADGRRAADPFDITPERI